MAPSSNDSSSNSTGSPSNSNSTPSNSGNDNSGGSNNNNNNNSGSTSNNNSSGNNNGNNNSDGNGNSGGNNGDKDSSGNNNGNKDSSGNNNSDGNDNSGGNNGNKDSSGKNNSSGSSNSGQNNNNSSQNNNSGQNSSNNSNSGQNNNNSSQNNNSGQNNSNNSNSGQNNNNSSQNNNSRQNSSNNSNSGQNNNYNSGQNGNNSSGQNNSNNNNGNQNNNNNSGQNNNNGGNSNSQGNRSPPPPPPPPPPKSSNWHAPPPPLSSRKSPPTSTSISNNNKSSPPSSASSPLIIGLAAGAGLLFVMLLLFFACSRRRKKRQSSHLMDNPDPYRPYGPGSDYWQSGAYKSNEHVLNMPPPPLSGWNTNPAAHHLPMVSSEMNSSNFSGPHGPLQPPPHPSVALGFNTSTFTYEDLAAATSGFSQAKLLGQGGFGFVHKGVLPNGKEIAVKSLKAGSGQGDREFAAEVEIISRVHHRHLVSLVGYCLNGERKLLVYEFVPNNTLEFHLYNKNRPSLEWPSRVKIALGSAKGLAYLHEDCHPKIIHRDIKAANILIDHHYEAKVADFGLAKLNQENVTHVSTRVMGTFGYLAPEYASSGKLTEKSDVFSFGIMLLELITGRRPVDTTGEYEEDTLVDWARPLLIKAIEERNYSELADPRLEKKYDQEEMARMVICASTSVRHSAKKRPKMSQIVRALEGDVSLEDLHEGIKPSPSALFGGSTTSSEFDSDSYNANMKNFRKPVLGESQDYPSSEYGNTSNSEEMAKKV